MPASCASRLPPRLLTLLKAGGVGAAATLVDLLALALLVEICGLRAVVANVPALLAGAIVQFWGSRTLVFSARSGSLRRQLMGFAITEALTLTLNGLAFHLLVGLLHLPYLVGRPLGTALVFFAFSFPMWRRVFRVPAPG